MGATSAVFSQPTYQPTYVQGGSTIISPQPATTIQTQGSVASIVRPATTTVGTTSLSPTHQTTIGTPVGTVASIGQPCLRQHRSWLSNCQASGRHCWQVHGNGGEEEEGLLLNNKATLGEPQSKVANEYHMFRRFAHSHQSDLFE